MRVYALYEPLKTFMIIGSVVFSVGFFFSLRFLYYYFIGQGGGHVQSLILSAVLMIVGFQVIMIGLLSDIISANRRLIEDVQYRVRKIESEKEEKNHSGVKK